jgi:hypothetical protein
MVCSVGLSQPAVTNRFKTDSPTANALTLYNRASIPTTTQSTSLQPLVTSFDHRQQAVVHVYCSGRIYRVQ